MYQINPDKNRLNKLSVKTFSDLGFREREHLQEWLVNTPDALGEELLIIQKEFDGFDDTRERLDLLVLDKDGNLVLIENKLDDSGKDVVWQSLKYASYCSALKKADIVRIYQEYLDRYQGSGDAIELICDFLDAEDFSDVILNSGIEQRIKLVAGNFRKEVTSTVLWLLQHNLEIQCYKATAYKFSEELFLNIEQIIPTPEAADFMIGISQKESEEKSAKRSKVERSALILEYWKEMLKEFRNSNMMLFDHIIPSDKHWLNISSGHRNIYYVLVILKFSVRVEVYFSYTNATSNKKFFDILYNHKEKIEDAFGNKLNWQRMDKKKACRICYEKGIESYKRENWPKMIDWMAGHISLLVTAFKEPMKQLPKS